MNGTLSELTGTPQRFLQWWWGELAELTPERLRRRMALSHDRVVLYVSDNEMVLLRQTVGGLSSLGSLMAMGAATSPESLRNLLDRLRGRGKPGDICIRVDPRKTVRKQVQLPLAAEENLREVMGFELDRLTPFSSDEVYFSGEIVDRNSSSQQLKADIVIVPRDLIDPALNAARACGFEPARIDVADAPGSYAGTAGNLLPPRLARRVGSKRLHLALIAIVLALIAAYLPIERMQSTRDDLAHRFSDVKATAALAASLRKEVDDLSSRQTFLIDLKHNRPMASQLLFEITHILPDNVYLSAWSLAGSEVQIEGTAQSASAVVALLEQSHLFQNTTFRSPVTQAPGSTRERFRISTKIVEGGQR